MLKKKILKKITAVLTGMVLSVGLVACGSQNSGSNTAEARQEREDVTSESAQELSGGEDEVQEEQKAESQTGQQAEAADQDSRVSREHENERNVELVSVAVADWESYDTVFIGYAGDIIGLN